MDGLKRTRCETRNYTERRNYLNKKQKSDGGFSGNSRKKTLTNALIFDNGGYSIKIGYTKDDNPTSLPNHIMKAKSERKRCFIADQIEDCRDLSGLFYLIPHEHGYITKFDVQKTVWDYTFNKFPIDDCPVVMTQPILNFKHIQEYMDEIFFEEYDVKQLYRASGTDYAYYEYINNHCNGMHVPCVVVDSGFSFTHIVPYIDGKKYTNGIIRMDIGGKLLTNYLKDILSYRQLHVMEETYVINQVKEDTCFMSTDFKLDMYRSKSTNEIVKNYVLPDFHNIRRGYVQDAGKIDELAEHYQILRLNNERISVPEVLMKPSLIAGMEQSGLAQNIAKCISKVPAECRKLLSKHIVFIGGNCLFPGFKERVTTETRMFLPCHYDLGTYLPEDPINYAWCGGRSFSRDPRFRSHCISKQNYEEYGSSYIYDKFNEFSVYKEEVIEKEVEKPFSYLEHWRDDGADIFHKAPMTHDASQNDVEFILEGDGIEEYDGKYVTLEFEYENQNQNQNIQLDEDPSLLLLKKKRIVRTDSLSSSPNSSPASTKTADSGISSSTDVAEEIIIGEVSNEITTRITKAPIAKVYKPVFRPKLEMIDRKPQIITLNSPVTLNGSSILVPSSNTKTITLNSANLLNNTVILPQNLVSFKKIIQVIPFRPQLITTTSTGNIILTKKQP